MALTSVEDMIAERPDGGENSPDRINRSASERDIVPHFIDVPSRAAEIDLHINHQKYRVLRAQIAIVGPRIGVGFDTVSSHCSSKEERAIDTGGAQPEAPPVPKAMYSSRKGCRHPGQGRNQKK